MEISTNLGVVHIRRHHPMGYGGGGFQMMTIDDKGGGGGLANDDVTTEIQILGSFLGFYMKFFQNLRLRELMRGLRSVELRKRRTEVC